MDLFSGKKAKCAGCGNKITGKEPTIKALKKEYHANCFVCKNCKQPVAGDYHTVDDHPWCVDCYVDQKASKCAECKKGIAGKKVRLDDGRYFHEECLNNASQGNCGACSKPIGLVEPIVDALGKNYHKDCFRCADCQTAISGEFQVRNDRPVCDKCAGRNMDERRNSTSEDQENRRNSGTVERLSETVTEVKLDDDSKGSKFYTEENFGGRDALSETLVRDAGDSYGNYNNGDRYPEELQSWFSVPRHRSTNLRVVEGEDCIVCAKPITEGIKVGVNGKNFHDECFDKAHAGKCSGCNKNIHLTEQSVAVNSLGRDWHSQCLNCGLCGNNITEAFSLNNNDPVCGHCYEEKLAPACAGCDRHVTGSVLRASNRTWHPECFDCEVCHEPLINGGANEFFNYDGKRYCKRDIEVNQIKVA